MSDAAARELTGGAARDVPGGSARDVPGGSARNVPGGSARNVPGGSARNAAVSFAGAVLAAVLGFVLYVVVVRGLGPEAAGVFFTVAGIFFILSNALELGADTGLLWALPRLKAHGRYADLRPVLAIALNPVWVASGVTGLALFLFAPQLAQLFFDGELAEQLGSLLRLISPAVVLAAPLTVALAGTRGLGSVVPFTLISNVGMPLARPVLIVLALSIGVGSISAIDAVVGAWSLPVALACAAAFVVLTRALRATEQRVADAGKRVRRPRAHSLLRGEFWTYSRPRAVSACMEIALVWTDVLLLSALASPREAGIYAAASRFVTTGTLAEAAMRVALSPRLSELLALGKVAEAGRLIGTASVWITAASWPLYLILATFGPYVLQIFGPEVVEGATALTILAVAMAISMTAGNVQTVLLMSGRSMWQLGNKTAALTVDIVLCVVLIPRHGMVGAAAAWAAAVLLDTALAAAQVRYGVGVRSTASVRGRRGVTDWRTEVAAVFTAMNPWSPERTMEPERRPGRRRTQGDALAAISRRGLSLLPVAAAGIVAFGFLGVVIRTLFGTGGGAFAGYLVISVSLYAAALWVLRPVLDLENVLSGLRRRTGGGGGSGTGDAKPEPVPGARKPPAAPAQRSGGRRRR